MSYRKQVFIVSPDKLRDGLYSGSITQAAVVGPYRRVSIGITADSSQYIRIDFEISPNNWNVERGNKAQLDRFLCVIGKPQCRDTSEIIGDRVGVRIHRGQFFQFESPLTAEVAK